MKIYDQKLAHYVYCRDQEQQIDLFDTQSGAITFQTMFEDEKTVSSLSKGAILSALLLTMSHAMEKGAKPVDVANHFFDAATVEEAVPKIEEHYDSLVVADAKSEKAQANAAYQITTNLIFLLRIAHKSLSSNRFEQKERLMNDFAQALKDNGWDLDHSSFLNALLDTELTDFPNNDIDMMLENAEFAFKQQLASANAHGSFESLEPHEYTLVG